MVKKREIQWVSGNAVDSVHLSRFGGFRVSALSLCGSVVWLLRQTGIFCGGRSNTSRQMESMCPKLRCKKIIINFMIAFFILQFLQDTSLCFLNYKLSPHILDLF